VNSSAINGYQLPILFSAHGKDCIAIADYFFSHGKNYVERNC